MTVAGGYGDIRAAHPGFTGPLARKQSSTSFIHGIVHRVHPHVLAAFSCPDKKGVLKQPSSNALNRNLILIPAVRKHGVFDIQLFGKHNLSSCQEE